MRQRHSEQALQQPVQRGQSAEDKVVPAAYGALCDGKCAYGVHARTVYTGLHAAVADPAAVWGQQQNVLRHSITTTTTEFSVLR